MKIAVLYDSKTGNTEKAAQLLCDCLPDCHAYNFTEEVPTLSDFDKIIIGGYIRYGGINNSSRDFVFNNEDILEHKNISLYLCSIEKDKTESQCRKFYSKRIIKNVRFFGAFGGDIPLNKLHGFQKILASKMIKKLNSPPELDVSAIRSFAEKLSAEL